jgi:hypothetical protein
MMGHLELGIRYILPIYSPLAAAGSAAALSLLQNGKAARLTAIALLSWHVIESARAHPDYLAYFNEFASSDPSRYLVDSNLDWGQDTLRLRSAVRELKIPRIGVALIGSPDLGRLEFPESYWLDARVPANGWIAVSDHLYRIDGWSWLKGRPYRRIGKTIRLYYIQ